MNTIYKLKTALVIFIALLIILPGYAQDTDNPNKFSKVSKGDKGVFKNNKKEKTYATSDSESKRTDDQKHLGIRIGPKLGYSTTNIAFSGEDGQLYQWASTSSSVIGVSSELRLHRKFGFQVEAQYTKKGFTTKPWIDYTQKYAMIEVPMMLKYTGIKANILGDFFSSDLFDLGVVLGPSYGMTFKVIGKDSEGRVELDPEELDFKKIHWSLAFGVMAEATVHKEHRMAFQLGGNWGLTDFDNDPEFTQFFNAYSASLIYYIPMKQHKTLTH